MCWNKKNLKDGVGGCKLLKLDVITNDEGTYRFDDENQKKCIRHYFFGFERVTPQT